jgi:hypothetical protein
MRPENHRVSSDGFGGSAAFPLRHASLNLALTFARRVSSSQWKFGPKLIEINDAIERRA